MKKMMDENIPIVLRVSIIRRLVTNPITRHTTKITFILNQTVESDSFEINISSYYVCFHEHLHIWEKNPEKRHFFDNRPHNKVSHSMLFRHDAWFGILKLNISTVSESIKKYILASRNI